MVAERIQELHDDVGLENMLVFSWLPGITREQSRASLELFAEQVMPRFTQTPSAVEG